MNNQIMSLFLLTYERRQKPETMSLLLFGLTMFLALSLDSSASWHEGITKSCILFCPDSFILKMVMVVVVCLGSIIGYLPSRLFVKI